MTRHAAFVTSALLVSVLTLAAIGGSAAAGSPRETDPYKARLIALPFIYYSPETNLAFGGGGVLNFRAGTRKEETRTSSVWAYASYNLARQFNVMVKPEIYLQGDDLIIDGTVRYERAPQLFYGVGNDMPSSDEESFTPRTFTVQFGVKRRLVGKLFAGLRYDFEQLTMEKFESGGILDGAGITGSRGGMYSGFGVSFDWDTRDAVLYPHKGVLVQLSADAFGAMAGSDLTFTCLKIDYRRYVPFGANRVLALQAYWHSTSGDVPFDRLALLGGESLLRGYYKGRFRDKGLLAIQAEYRVFVTKRIGVAGFAGLADVFSGLGEFRLEKLKVSVGSGLRYMVNKRDGTTLRLDMAWGRASFGLYLTAKEAF
jgi:outer membrane protein assembly factor BamA